jgi:hypothetical protein
MGFALAPVEQVPHVSGHAIETAAPASYPVNAPKTSGSVACASLHAVVLILAHKASRPCSSVQNSSDQSLQSLLPLFASVLAMHLPFLHWNQSGCAHVAS